MGRRWHGGDMRARRWRRRRNQRGAATAELALGIPLLVALTAGLERAGYRPALVETTATVHVERGEDGFRIPRIELDCTAAVPGIDDDEFQAQATAAKEGCPVSKALAGTEITLEATLVE